MFFVENDGPIPFFRFKKTSRKQNISQLFCKSLAFCRKLCYTGYVFPAGSARTPFTGSERLHTLNNRTHKPISPRRRKDREIARLRSELASERSRSAKLEREIAALKRELQEQALPRKPIHRLARRNKSKRREDRLLDRANRHARYYRKRSFFRYLLDSFRESSFMRVARQVYLYLRRFRLLQTIIAILLAAGAVTAVALVSPLAVLILLLVTILPTAFTLWRFHCANQLLRRELRDGRIRILIPMRKQALEPNSFFLRNARAMAAEEKVTVIVVTPYVFSQRGAGRKGAFFTARKDADGLYMVRRHYFFTLRRKVLDVLDGEITVIY